MTIEQELEQAQARITELEAAATSATEAHSSALATVNADLDTARKSATEAIRAKDEAITQRDTEKARADKSELDFKAHKEGEPARLNAEAQRILATSGHAPIEVSVDNSPAGKKPDLSKLTGLDKAIAAHKLSTTAN